MSSCTSSEAGVLQDLSYLGSEQIRLNQVGFYPSGPKRAVVVDSTAISFSIKTYEEYEVVFEGELSPPKYWEFSGERVRIAEFSAFSLPGKYVLHVEGLGSSHPFEIGEDLLQSTHISSLKSYYFQRASLALGQKEGGKWMRKAGHSDTRVKIHASASTPNRPAGTYISAPKGWYDAGDYGKYTSNASYATWLLLHLYEGFPSRSKELSYGLPESANPIPDILDESLWSIRWLLHMQEPTTGMVYHKLTTLHHAA